MLLLMYVNPMRADIALLTDDLTEKAVKIVHIRKKVTERARNHLTNSKKYVIIYKNIIL